MKAAPLFHELKESDQFQVQLIHTGQHYDPNLSGKILEDLGLPQPDFNLEVGSGSHAVQTANIMIRYEELCENRSLPDLVVVVGDVNSTIACALTAKKLGLQVAHLEAGLRSRDMGMPEEVNRVLTDRISDVLWTPSRDGDQNLLHEGVDPSKISFVGNLMIDTLVNLSPRIDEVDIQTLISGRPEKFCLVTLHRPSNVDDHRILDGIIGQLRDLSIERNLKIIFPVHPRTRKNLEVGSGAEIVSQTESIMLLDPLPYIQFMALVKRAEFLITDSGGIQEETTYLGIPCFTLRPNTERPITIECGSNTLATPETLLTAVENKLNSINKEHRIPDFWDGKSAGRVVDDIKDRYNLE